MRQSQKFTPRGVMEMAEKNPSLKDTEHRKEKWQKLYKLDKFLQRAMDQRLPELKKKKFYKRAERVGELAKATYAKASEFHHQFDMQAVLKTFFTVQFNSSRVSLLVTTFSTLNKFSLSKQYVMHIHALRYLKVGNKSIMNNNNIKHICNLISDSICPPSLLSDFDLAIALPLPQRDYPDKDLTEEYATQMPDQQKNSPTTEEEDASATKGKTDGTGQNCGRVSEQQQSRNRAIVISTRDPLLKSMGL